MNNRFDFRLPSELEKCFIEIAKKIELIKKQYILTLKFYESEFNYKNEQITKINEQELKSAWAKYLELMRKTKGEDPYENHEDARLSSGLKEVENEIRIEKYLVSEEHKEFLDSYSKSILLMIYSLLEGQTQRICEITKAEFDAIIGIKNYRSDKKGYFNSYIDYLKVILGFETNTLENKYIDKINELRLIRNKVAHTNSIFTEENAKNIKRIVEKSEGGLSINQPDGNQLIIENEKYIFLVFDFVLSYFQDLLSLIDSNQRHKILKKRLLQLFTFKIQIKEITVERKSNSVKLILVVDTEESDIPTFTTKLIFSKDKPPIKDLEIINQMTSVSNSKFTEWIEDEINGAIVRKLIEPFLPKEEMSRITFFVYEN